MPAIASLLTPFINLKAKAPEGKAGPAMSPLQRDRQIARTATAAFAIPWLSIGFL
ncbi:MAG TPA: hypothetical protein VMB84_11855 [Stellaceae bacterium]|nr:hypothetical protein [Stellaceae bacterium]